MVAQEPRASSSPAPAFVWAGALIGGIAALSFLGLPAEWGLLKAGLKPVPVLCLAALYGWWANGVRRWLLFGLVLSAFGDLYLAVGDAYFIHGLTAFLVAHLFYVAGLGGSWGLRDGWLALPAAIWGIAMAVIIIPHSGDLGVPVGLYITALCSMIWRACSQWHHHRDSKAAIALAGACLFGLSDTLLALRLFVEMDQIPHLAVMLTYWFGQWGIAQSMTRSDS